MSGFFCICFECNFSSQEGLNILHCAVINNHTEIVEYIVEDLQMKELDKMKAVYFFFFFFLSKQSTQNVWYIFTVLWLACMPKQAHLIRLCFSTVHTHSRYTLHSGWLRKTAAWRCSGC